MIQADYEDDKDNIRRDGFLPQLRLAGGGPGRGGERRHLREHQRQHRELPQGRQREHGELHQLPVRYQVSSVIEIFLT